MKRALRWIIGIVSLLLLLCVGVFVFKDAILRKFVEYRVARETGVGTTIGSLHLDLLAGSIQVTDFKLANPPGFGEGPMLHMAEVFIQIDRESPPGGVRLHQARVNLAEFNIIRSADGRTNVFALEKRLRKKKKKKSEPDDEDLEFRGIGELKISVGTVRYIDLQKPSRSQEFKVNVRDELVTTIKTEEDLKTWATAFLIRVAIQQALEKSHEGGNLLDLLRPKR